MSARDDAHPAFRDGQHNHGRLLDHLLDEVAIVLAEHRKDRTGNRNCGDERWENQDLQEACLALVSHPAIRHRLQRLEHAIGQLWFDPLAETDWPPAPPPGGDLRTMIVDTPPTGRIAGGNGHDSPAAIGRARIASSAARVMVPTITEEEAARSPREIRTVGTWIQGHDEPVLGRLDETSLDGGEA